MIKGSDVLTMLLPNGGWTIIGNDYEAIQFLECEPITKNEYELGFTTYENWKKEQDVIDQQKREQAIADKAALLNKLGISEDEVKLLLG